MSTKKINVLIKSANNKKHLIQEFQKYANVFVEDKNPNAKCFLYADVHNHEQIDLEIKTRDGDIQHRICSDKAEFERFCRRHGFSIPETWMCDTDQKFIVKKRNGSGSRNQFVIDRSVLVQEFVNWPEYSIDYFADNKGHPISIIPRKRLDVWDGESHRAEVCFDSRLVSEGLRMGQDLDIHGPATMQLFFNGKQIKWIEVNPRYGGGSHLTWHIFSGPKFQVEEVQKMRDLNVSTFKRNKVQEVR